MIQPWLILAYVAAAGLCMGSFLNVVILRLPENRSLISPPSTDPITGDRLKWWENIPVVSWVVLRGKSRYSGQRISVQYPLIEAFTGLLFAGTYLAYYQSGWRPAFSEAGIGATWAVLIVHLLLLASLIAATAIDFKLFIIPLEIPWTATAIAVLALPIATAAGWLPTEDERFNSLVPVASAPGVGAAIGGAAGLAVGLGLMWLKAIPRSFDEPTPEAYADSTHQSPETSAEAKRADWNKDVIEPNGTITPTGIAQEREHEADEPLNPESLIAHPHPRREVLKELMLLGFPLLGMLIGLVFAADRGPDSAESIPASLLVLAGVVNGYLIGGGLVWLTRILGTLAFNKEAMGLGDVHLLAAIGAVIGGFDSALVFFIAPFMGLAAAAVMAIIAAFDKQKVRVIPYGPYLAAAAALMMLARGPIINLLTELDILSPGMRGM